MVTNKTLCKIAVYGAVGCISAVMYMRYKIQDRIRNTDYFRQAFKILRAHPGAMSLLGEPIKEQSFDLGDQKNFCDGNTAKFEVNVCGPKDRGVMYFWAERDEKAGWHVDRVELEVNKQPDKRLLVKKLIESQLEG